MHVTCNDSLGGSALHADQLDVVTNLDDTLLYSSGDHCAATLSTPSQQHDVISA
jgi:hypothetical protein